MKITTKTVSVPNYYPTYTQEDVTVYTCSDGKEFTSERDTWSGYKTGKQMADEYEEYLQKQNIVKKEIKFYSILNNKHDNEGYERKFCFYYQPNLSKETKEGLVRLVYDFRYTEDVNKLQEGWYLVDQRVYEVDSSCRSQQYGCDGEVKLLSELIEEKEEDLKNHQNIFNQLNQTL